MHSPGSGLVLGCAQLGMLYGVANTTGQPDVRTALDLVGKALQGGIRAFDTAPAYGDSETVLGKCLAELGIRETVEVYTKLPPDVDPANCAAVLNCARRSIERLGVDSLAGILFHRESALELWNRGGQDSAQALLETGLTRRVGVSCYGSDAAMNALGKPLVDVLQVPANVLDRRFATVCRAATETDKVVMLRSVYLQGLLLLEPTLLPAKLSFASQKIREVRALAESFALPVRVLAVHYAKQAYPGTLVILGAETPEQVRQNTDIWNMPAVPGLVEAVEQAFLDQEERLLNPTLWESQ